MQAGRGNIMVLGRERCDHDLQYREAQHDDTTADGTSSGKHDMQQAKRRGGCTRRVVLSSRERMGGWKRRNMRRQNNSHPSPHREQWSAKRKGRIMRLKSEVVEQDTRRSQDRHTTSDGTGSPHWEQNCHGGKARTCFFKTKGIPQPMSPSRGPRAETRLIRRKGMHVRSTTKTKASRPVWSK
ncbi:hypothetical protein CONLIGDRAFT_142293 [Coniochaeta ligniaria NRRL 30616]|uniref:Uncharacterized protein n=1 Tax=Coniochaeta ligniaria NRRL 30616 TaxID=1408157 RepID=A0A1J7I7J2_9PEZI|nr:hypothetical protein CONLIGDRAFT_142293 [Coniochaeta ligniaria NRRL 30616]